MTEAELARWEADAREDIAVGSAPYGAVPPEDVLALIAEVRRLRAALAEYEAQWARHLDEIS